MTISNLTTKRKKVSSGITPFSSFIVTNTNDSGAGSLRQAIEDYHLHPFDGFITFNIAGNPPHLIVLESSLEMINNALVGNNIYIPRLLTITGTNVDDIIISPLQGNGQFSLFWCSSDLDISNLTIKDWENTVFRASGNLSINNCKILNNGYSPIQIDNGSTTFIMNSTIKNNSNITLGGAITNAGTLYIYNCLLDGNITISCGGALFNWATATISNSTFVNNICLYNNSSLGGFVNSGGAIYNNKEAVLNLYNCTFADNINSYAQTEGGAIYNSALPQTSPAGIINIANTLMSNSKTITVNTSNSYTQINDYGGGGTVNIISGASASNNLVSKGSYNWATTVSLNNMNLGSLGANGGPTETIALNQGSYAIHTGSSTVSNAQPVSGKDQRGYTRSTTTPNIGAWEN